MIHLTDQDFKELSKRNSKLQQITSVKDAKTIKKSPKQPKTYKRIESGISKTIETFFAYHGWYTLRLNAGLIKIDAPNGKSRWFKGVDKGTPDRVFFRAHKNGGVLLLFAEIKKQTEKPKEHQKIAMQKLRKYGARCVVIHSLEDAQRIHDELKNEVVQYT